MLPPWLPKFPDIATLGDYENGNKSEGNQRMLVNSGDRWRIKMAKWIEADKADDSAHNNDLTNDAEEDVRLDDGAIKIPSHKEFTP